MDATWTKLSCDVWMLRVFVFKTFKKESTVLLMNNLFILEAYDKITHDFPLFKIYCRETNKHTNLIQMNVLIYSDVYMHGLTLKCFGVDRDV